LLCPSCLIKNIDDFARNATDDPSAVRVNIQGEILGSEISLGVEINHNPQCAMLRHAGQSQSIDSVEASTYDRPPAIDPADHQFKVERLDGKRRKGRTVEYLVKWLGDPENESTWEKKKDIDPDIVSAYEANLMLGHDQV
jgi:hypothetical protein